MEKDKKGWLHVLLGALLTSAIFGGIGCGMVLLQLRDRQGRPMEAWAVPFFAAFGAVIGGINSWRAGRIELFGRYRSSRPLSETLRELTDASRGSSDEAKATRVIAVAAVIPAVICAILLAWLTVSDRDSAAWLAFVCAAAAIVAGFGTLLVVWAVYRVFGFATVAVVGNMLLFGYSGFFLGAILGKILDSWWPWLLGPLGMLAGLFAPRQARGPSTGSEGQPTGQEPEKTGPPPGKQADLT